MGACGPPLAGPDAASESSGHYQQQIVKLGAVLAAPPVRDAYELTVVA
jgi:hypothetical protein